MAPSRRSSLAGAEPSSLHSQPAGSSSFEPPAKIVSGCEPNGSVQLVTLGGGVPVLVDAQSIGSFEPLTTGVSSFWLPSISKLPTVLPANAVGAATISTKAASSATRRIQPPKPIVPIDPINNASSPWRCRAAPCRHVTDQSVAPAPRIWRFPFMEPPDPFPEPHTRATYSPAEIRAEPDPPSGRKLLRPRPKSNR